jgi:hypothetical protein
MVHIDLVKFGVELTDQTWLKPVVPQLTLMYQSSTSHYEVMTRYYDGILHHVHSSPKPDPVEHVVLHHRVGLDICHGHTLDHLGNLGGPVDQLADLGR